MATRIMQTSVIMFFVVSLMEPLVVRSVYAKDVPVCISSQALAQAQSDAETLVSPPFLSMTEMRHLANRFGSNMVSQFFPAQFVRQCLSKSRTIEPTTQNVRSNPAPNIQTGRVAGIRLLPSWMTW